MNKKLQLFTPKKKAAPCDYCGKPHTQICPICSSMFCNDCSKIYHGRCPTLWCRPLLKDKSK